jgi:hypothetical protein
MAAAHPAPGSQGSTVSVVSDLANSIAIGFGTSATPFAFLLDEEGRVLIRGIANDWTQLERMLAEEGTFQTHPWNASDETGTNVAGSSVISLP